MFTGLIETLGTIVECRSGAQDLVLGIVPQKKEFVCAIGDSVAINGVCLTIEKISGTTFWLRAVDETLHKSTLRELRTGVQVNLERALRLSDRLGGHIVLGHVDTIASIIVDRKAGESIYRTISAPVEIRKFLAPKGSITVDGISLTIADRTDDTFTISFIPHTLAVTTMGFKKAGDQVNLECDVLARYIFQLFTGDKSSASLDAKETKATLLDKMESFGF